MVPAKEIKGLELIMSSLWKHLPPIGETPPITVGCCTSRRPGPFTSFGLPQWAQQAPFSRK